MTTLHPKVFLYYINLLITNTNTLAELFNFLLKSSSRGHSDITVETFRGITQE